MARRDHPLGVPVRDGAGLARGRRGRSRGLADDLTTGTSTCGSRSARSTATPGPGWTVEVAIAGTERPLRRSRRSAAGGGREFAEPEADLLPRTAAHAPRTAEEAETGWPALHAWFDPPAVGVVGGRLTFPASRRGRRSSPHLEEIRRHAARPAGAVVDERASGSGSAGSRSSGATCCSTGGAS